MFSFQASSGSTSTTPSFGFGGASSSGAAFGAQSQSAFGASPMPSFGATTSTPAFGAASSSSFTFNAASSPSLFGQSSAPKFGSSTGTSFGGSLVPSSSPSLFGQSSFQSFGGVRPGFGQQPPQQLQQNTAAQQLLTKDNRPIAHGTKWEDLSPQAQQYLMELEKIVNTCAQECKQLEDQEQFQSGTDATIGIDEQARIISQNVSALSIRERIDDEEIESLREASVHLVRHTESAVYSFKRACAWRNIMQTAASGQSLEELGPPMSLPYPFLAETLADFQQKLKSQLVAAQELEITLKDKTTSRIKKAGSEADATLIALQSSISNLHDCLMRVAAQLQKLDDSVNTAKAKVLSALHKQEAYVKDPFRNAATEEAAYRSSQDANTLNSYAELHVPDPSLGLQQQRPNQQQIPGTQAPTAGTGALLGTSSSLLFGRK